MDWTLRPLRSQRELGPTARRSVSCTVYRERLATDPARRRSLAAVLSVLVNRFQVAVRSREVSNQNGFSLLGIVVNDEAAVTALAEQTPIDVAPASIRDGRACDVLVEGKDITFTKSLDINGNPEEAK